MRDLPSNESSWSKEGESSRSRRTLVVLLSISMNINAPSNVFDHYKGNFFLKNGLLTVNFSLADLHDDPLILMNHMCFALKFLSSLQLLIFITLGFMAVDHIVINKTLTAELNSRHIL